MKTATKTTKKTAHAVHATAAAAATVSDTTAVQPATGVPAAIAPATPPTSAPAASSPVAVIPTEAQVAELLAVLDGVRTLLGDSAVELTAQQRKRALRAKKGGEPTVGLMVGLGTQYGVQLPGVDPVGIQQYALLAQRLQPLDTRMRVISGLVTDTVANAKAESWEGTTALYTALSRVAKRNASLQKELKPAVAFFKRRRAATAAVASPKNVATGEVVSASPPTPVTPVTEPPALPPSPVAEGAPATPATIK